MHCSMRSRPRPRIASMAVMARTRASPLVHHIPASSPIVQKHLWTKELHHLLPHRRHPYPTSQAAFSPPLLRPYRLHPRHCQGLLGPCMSLFPHLRHYQTSLAAMVQCRLHLHPCRPVWVDLPHRLRRLRRLPLECSSAARRKCWARLRPHQVWCSDTWILQHLLLRV